MVKIELLSSLTAKQISMLIDDFSELLMECEKNQSETAIGFTIAGFIELQKKHEKLFRGLKNPADVLAIAMLCHEITLTIFTRMKKNLDKSLEKSAGNQFKH